MKILFPSRPSDSCVDSAFQAEKEAAEAAGFQTALVDISLNFGGEVTLRRVDTDPVLYRGWILKSEYYDRLAAAVRLKGSRLIVSPQEYRFSYEFPRWYEILNKHYVTPFSATFDKDTIHRLGGFDQNMDAICKYLATVFVDTPALVKDYLKSRKHEWYDACFIRDASDAAEVKRVVGNFIKLQEQDESFNGGLVFRSFMPLKQIGIHLKSKMPLVNEWRAFVWNGKIFHLAPYWSDGANYENCDRPDVSAWNDVLSELGSRFVSLDIAQREDGKWFIIEVNDGGSAGIPDGTDPKDFYTALKHVT